MPEYKENQPRSSSRRNFLKVSGAALGGVVGGGIIGAVLNILNNTLTKPEEQPPVATPEEQPLLADFNQALMYFIQLFRRISDYDPIFGENEPEHRRNGDVWDRPVLHVHVQRRIFAWRRVRDAVNHLV